MVQGTQTLEEMVQTMPQEHVQNRTAEQTMDILMPPLIEKIGAKVQNILHERMQYRTAEQTANITVLQIMANIADVEK